MAAAAAPSARRHPRGLAVLFFTEMWERFSYYGMRSLLVYYTIEGLHWSVGEATALYGLYTGSVYLTPIVGGYLTDRLLGTERAIGLGAALMALGHFSLALPQAAAFYLGLALLAAGCGLFKPNVSLLLGSLYGPADPRRDAGFGWFYMGINLGALAAPLVCGTLGQAWGWHYGFAAAGTGMLAAWGIFAWQWPKVRPEGAATQPVGGAAGAAASSRPAALRASELPKRPDQRERRERRDRWLLLGVLGAIGNIVFWAAFEQAGSSIALFVERGGDLHLPFGGFEVPASWYQSFNPVAIILLTPLLGALWRALAARGREPQAPLKFACGLLLLATSFVYLSYLGSLADAGHKVALLAFVGPTLLATASELCISPVGLALASNLAPAGQKSLAMGLWFASMALGNLLAGLFAGHYTELSHARFFAEPALACALGAALLLLACPWLTRRLELLTGKARK